MTSPYTQLSPSLIWFRDICNVYLIRDGDSGILIDSGSGDILDHLDELGIARIEWVLHTHHHRDQSQGDPRLIEQGARIAVPAREASLFEHVDAFWRNRSTFDDYDTSSDWNSPAMPIPVHRGLRDYETFSWRGFDIVTQPTPGHTRGSVTYLVEVDGSATAFSGDLIAAPGHVDTIHDLQWQYGMPDALGAALHSATLLASKRIDRIAPSHGRPMIDATAALQSLAGNLRELYGSLSEVRQNRVWLHHPHSVDQPKTQILPHLWANTHSLSNTYALVADDGATMLMDYGFPSWDHYFAGKRFVEHTIAELQADAGVRSIDVVVPSHYHDDHLAGVPWLQQEHGTQAWIYDRFVEMVARPSDWKLPCLLGETITADRAIGDGERVSWNDWSFDVFHMPGHTWWALGLVGEVDGTRVAMTGDNLLAGALSPLRSAYPIYRNQMRIDSLRLGVERLIEFEPELLLTGHTGAIEVDRQMLDDLIGWARQVEGAFTRLCVVPERINESLDPDFVVCFPYLQTVTPGSRFRQSVRVTNHGPDAETAVVSLLLPEGWSAEPAAAESNVEPGATATLDFDVTIASDEPVGRRILLADLTLGNRRFGHRAEAIVDIANGRVMRSASAAVDRLRHPDLALR